MKIETSKVYRLLVDIGNNPRPDIVFYNSIQDYVKDEVIQINGGRYKYYYKGMRYNNKYDVKNAVICYIKEYDTDCDLRKSKAVQIATCMINDMVHGKYALVFEDENFDKKEKNTELHIIYKNIQNNELNFITMSRLEYQRKVFEIEDSIGMEILNFPPTYHVLKIKGW